MRTSSGMRTVRSREGIMFFLIVGAASAACDSAQRPDGFATEPVGIRDSAGVTIVENLADTAALPIWFLDTIPLLHLGEIDADPAYEFSSVNAGVRLSDGRLVIVDELELRFFGADGAHLRTVGGRGAGPGEYRLIHSIGRFGGDSIFVWESAVNRATVLSPDGETVRVSTLRPPPAQRRAGAAVAGLALRPVFPAAGGGWIAATDAPAWPPENVRLPVLHAAPEPILRFDDAGVLTDTLAPTAGSAMLFVPAPVRQLAGGAVTGGYLAMSPASTLKTYVALRGDRFYVGDSSSFEIHEYSVSGALLRIIRYPQLDRLYGEAEFDERRQRSLATAREDNSVRVERGQRRRSPGEVEERVRAVDAMTDPAWKPPMRPSFSALTVDAAARLWVREWGGATDRPARWIVFDTAGRAIAVAEMPRSTPLDIGEDHALIREIDDLGVNFVTLRPLRAIGPPK